MAEPLFLHSGKDLRITYHICLVYIFVGNMDVNLPSASRVLIKRRSSIKLHRVIMVLQHGMTLNRQQGKGC